MFLSFYDSKPAGNSCHFLRRRCPENEQEGDIESCKADSRQNRGEILRKACGEGAVHAFRSHAGDPSREGVKRHFAEREYRPDLSPEKREIEGRQRQITEQGGEGRAGHAAFSQ